MIVLSGLQYQIVSARLVNDYVYVALHVLSWKWKPSNKIYQQITRASADFSIL